MATTMAQGDMAWPEPSVRAILDQRRLRSVYQPIVDLCTGATVAYEALTRGPAGTALESPDRLFQAARDDGLLAELDAACQVAALVGATAVGLGSANCLFINAEPNVWRPDPRHAGGLGGPDELGFDVVVELTERELARHPLTVLDDVRRLKALGFGIAIDDLGAEPASLALLPFIEPDIIKLDLRLIQDYGTAEIADIALAVQADAERRSSVVLAEGIETEADADTARVLGAEFGQGWHFGHPGPLPEPERRAAPGLWERLPHSPTRRTPARSPWELVADRPDRKVASKELLLPISHHIEHLVERPSEAPVLLGAFQHADHFTPATATRYRTAARHCSIVGAVGVDLPSEPAPNVRGGRIDRGHPLAGEWTVTVVGPHHAVALIARDLGDDGPDRQRRFEYLVTHDRSLVIAAAQILLELLVPTDTTGPGGAMGQDCRQ